MRGEEKKSECKGSHVLSNGHVPGRSLGKRGRGEEEEGEEGEEERRGEV